MAECGYLRSMKYRWGFDVWGLGLFLLMMIPTMVWSMVPAPNDVLRTESVTPVVDTIASTLQFLAIACLCVLINKTRGKLRFSPLVFLTVICIVLYFAGWALYYCGSTGAWVILLLTIPPSLALVLFAVDRKNLPAAMLATGFAICHLIFALVNFIL
ncbi:MAG: hypothetical protein J6Q22_15740 [Prevotella sp.]|nr:hypothetical protein [Prevotella sp.]